MAGGGGSGDTCGTRWRRSIILAGPSGGGERGRPEDVKRGRPGCPAAKLRLAGEVGNKANVAEGEAAERGWFDCDKHRTAGICSVTMMISNRPTRPWGILRNNTEMSLLLPRTVCATALASASASVPFSRLRASRLRASHLLSAFPRLRKYGRRHREPVAAASFDDEEEETEAEAEEEGHYDEEEEEMEVDEEFLATRPKPVGFGVGKTYSTDIEEQLLREMGVGGARRRGEPAPAKRSAGDNSDKETGADLIFLGDRSPKIYEPPEAGVQVRVWNLPKKKNIHKDLKQAFKGFPGLLTINPAVSANKKTRDPICKGFAYLKMESVEAATRFVEVYSRENVSFGKVQKPIGCCIVDGHSSVEASSKASNSQEILQPKSKHQNLVATRSVTN